MSIKNNTTSLQNILDMANNLPDAKATPNLQDKTVTPTQSNQTITADSGYDGLSEVTVMGDANLVAENIAEGVTIFNITGTHSGGSGGGDEGPNAFFAVQTPVAIDRSTSFGAYVQVIPFKMGMTWQDFYESRYNGILISRDLSRALMLINEGENSGSPAVAYWVSDTMVTLWELTDENGELLSFDQEIQAVDLDTMSPIYRPHGLSQ